MTEEAVKACFKEIIENKKDKTLNYAIGYVEQGLSMTGPELKMQCLYVLSNITHWKHPYAKGIRAGLKEFAA